MRNRVQIDISYQTILFIAGFLILLWIIYLIIDIILLLFVAFILVSALSPIVDKLTSWKLPRPLAIIVVFVVLISTIIGLLTLGITPLVSQTSNLFQALGEVISNLIKSNYVDQSVIRDELSTLSHQIVGFSLSLVENLVAYVSVVVITFYMLLDKPKFEGMLTSFFVNRQEKIKRLLNKIEYKLGAWLRGQLILSLTVGLLVYIGLTLINMEFALPLAILAALLEAVPVIGPIISAIPAILLALTVSPFLAAIVGGLYLAIQQLEGHIIVPQVMKRAVGLNPILVILAVAVGGRLLGIGGAFLAVPIAVVIQVILEETLHIPQLGGNLASDKV